MSSVLEFIKRHKGKIIVGGIVAGGAIAAYTTKSHQKQSQSYSVRETDIFKVQARRHYVFDTNHRSCDQSIIDLVPSIKALIQARFDVDLLTRHLQEDEQKLSKEQKIEVWQKIKIATIARIVGLAYSYSLLTVALKAQISILASEICAQFETPPESLSWRNYLPTQVSDLFVSAKSPQTLEDTSLRSNVDVMSRQIFLQCIQYYTTKGIPELLNHVETVVQDQLENVSLTDEIDKDGIRDILDKVDAALTNRNFSQLIAPLDYQDHSSTDGVMMLLRRLVNSIESEQCRNTMVGLVDLYLTSATQKLPSSGRVAKLLPPLAEAFHHESSTVFDAALHSSLCSSDLHHFSTFVFNSPRF